MTRHTKATALAVLATGALLLGACGDDSAGGDDDDTTTTTVDTTSTDNDDGTTAEAPEDQAIAAYRASQEFLSRALGDKPPDPDHPEVGEHFSGQALSNAVQLLFDANQKNEYSQDTIALNPTVVSVTDDEVVLSDCAEETYEVFDVATGAPTDSGTQIYNFRVTVVRGEEGWRVDEMDILEETCAP